MVAPIAWWIIWRKAHSSEVALLTVGAGGFFVLLAGIWIWVALLNSPLRDTVPYAFVLMAAGAILLWVGRTWYTLAKQQEIRALRDSFL